MVVFNFFLAFIFTFFLSLSSHSEVMFEGYYQIRSGGVHVGFVIQQYNFDSAKKQFNIVYYIKTNQLAGNITESLKAFSNDKFDPISYQYTTITGETLKAFDASFQSEQMNYVLSDGNTKNQLQKKIPKGTFLASFLNYMILSRGLSVGKVYDYDAIAEERAEVMPGKVLVKEEVTEMGIPGFKLLNEYGETRYISVMTKNGEVLSTKSPVQGIETQLVATAAEATKGFMLDTKSLKILFGNIPTGKINQLFKIKYGSPSPTTNPSVPNNIPPANQTSPTPVLNPAPQVDPSGKKNSTDLQNNSPDPQQENQ
jgi:hypothetical protein